MQVHVQFDLELSLEEATSLYSHLAGIGAVPGRMPTVRQDEKRAHLLGLLKNVDLTSGIVDDRRTLTNIHAEVLAI